MTTETDSGELLDARGLKCPLPVLRTEKRLAQLAAGAHLTVLASDPLAKLDIPLYCQQQGHACSVAEVDGGVRFTIRKGNAAQS